VKRVAQGSRFASGGGRSIARIFKPSLRVRLLSSLWGGLAAPLSQNAMDGQVEDVRARMLVHLCKGKLPTSSLYRRIQYADDIQALWYLRSDLMAALAFAHGETMAKREMAAITEAFQAALPKAMRIRAGRAGH
jgi:hypothetical protein